MASIRKRGDRWQAQVRRSGSPPINKTFNAREDAVRWAREQDRTIDRGECSGPATKLGGDLRVSELLHQYQRDVGPRKRSPADTFLLRTLARALGTHRVSSLQPSHLALYRDLRLKEVAPATVVREMAIFCHVLKTAVDEWGLSLPVEKFRAVRKPTLPPAGEKVSNRAIARPRNYRDALLHCGVTNNLKAKGTALLKTTKVAHELVQTASVGLKTVRLNVYANAYHRVLSPFLLRE